MIASRRRLHFVAIRILLPLGLVALIVPLTFREPTPQTSAAIFAQLESTSTAPGHVEEALPEAAALWQDAELFGVHPIRVTVLSDGSFKLKPLRQIGAPDVLLYWSATETVRERLPDDALLLGRISDTRERRFSVPSIADGHATHAKADTNDGDRSLDGTLVLYSLGHQSIIAVADLSAGQNRRASQ